MAYTGAPKDAVEACVKPLRAFFPTDPLNEIGGGPVGAMLKKFKIFISGVQKELKTERWAVKDFVLKDPLLWKYLGLEK